MARLYVCPLAHMARVAADSGAGSLVSLLTPPASAPRPETIETQNHLQLGFADLLCVDAYSLTRPFGSSREPGTISLENAFATPRDGLSPASADQLATLLDFVTRWDRAAPLLIHCFAGVSRSPAAAFIALCALTGRREADIAADLRRLSPSATPNRHMVALADTLLTRNGRMVAAAESIGRGADCFEGESFYMDIPCTDLA
jgi:predicted protein tyrosine phosphatase